MIFLLTFRRGIHQRLENRSDAKGKIQNTVVIEVATIVKGKTFYELIRRNKSGDRSGNELRCINDGRHGTGVANAACPTSLPLLLTQPFDGVEARKITRLWVTYRSFRILSPPAKRATGSSDIR